jgi:hypothetical protein
MINQRFRLLCAKSFDESHRINCNHHHLADVESLDIEIKHKNYLKHYFSPRLLSFLLAFAFACLLFSSLGRKRHRGRGEEIKFSTANEKRERTKKQLAAHTTFPHQKNLHYFSFKFKVWRGCVSGSGRPLEYIFHMFRINFRSSLVAFSFLLNAGGYRVTVSVRR